MPRAGSGEASARSRRRPRPGSVTAIAGMCGGGEWPRLNFLPAPVQGAIGPIFGEGSFGRRPAPQVGANAGVARSGEPQTCREAPPIQSRAGLPSRDRAPSRRHSNARPTPRPRLADATAGGGPGHPRPPIVQTNARSSPKTKPERVSVSAWGKLPRPSFSKVSSPPFRLRKMSALPSPLMSSTAGP